ncbi:hypothetical protein RB595_007934 [Gaeumannomyces hyphopodioides]
MASSSSLQTSAGVNQGHNSDFIARFTNKESRRRAEMQHRPTVITAAQHRALSKQLQDVQLLPPNYADNTKLNIAGILKKWKHYCEFTKLPGSWEDELKKANKGTTMSFLVFLCQLYKIRAQGTLGIYRRQFKQLYALATGKYMDMNDSRETKKLEDHLAKVFKLQKPNVAAKDVADAGDLLALLTFNIAYDTGTFSGERYRIQLSACYLALAYTGARPAELVDGERRSKTDGCYQELFLPNASREPLLDGGSAVLEDLLSQESNNRGRPKALCYEDISLMVVRHPETGKDDLVMSIKFTHHKGADNKPKPTVFFFTTTQRLIFCLISAIVSLALHDKAFAAETLVDARSIFDVKNQGPIKCTPIRWKPECLKQPIFRNFDDSMLSDNQPLPYSKFNDDLERQSLDCGFERAMTAKAFRRGAANAADGNASDAVRDQMLRHDPKFATFNSAYLNANVRFHLQNAVLDEPTDDRLIKMLGHMGLMRDPRASKNMVPDEIWRNMPPDPDITKVEAEREQLKNGQYRIRGTKNEERIRELSGMIVNMRAQRRKDIEQSYRQEYFLHRPTWDIEKQQTHGFATEEDYTQPTINLHIPERAELAEIICNQPKDLDPEQHSNLRIRAIELMAALCDKRQSYNWQRRPARTIAKTKFPAPDCFPILMHRAQCPVCIGDTRLSYRERTFVYCRPSVMCNHFDRNHKKKLSRGGKQLSCNHPKCKEEDLHFNSLDHFKNHVQNVHGVSLRP